MGVKGLEGSPISVNIPLTEFVLAQLTMNGVEEFCVCPGKRNAPFVEALTRTDAARQEGRKVYFFYEERCAAFFALGRIRVTGRPVAVVTTSGTAVGELLPATMEAYYSGLPLVLLTADRPRSYRGSGAPQAAEQLGIFGVYSDTTLDLEGTDREFKPLSWERPAHINVCFDEPLIDGEWSGKWNDGEWNTGKCAGDSGVCSSSISSFPVQFDPVQSEGLEEFTSTVKAPLILVGMLRAEEREAVAQFLLRTQAPVYLEAISGLREDSRIKSFQVFLPDRILELAAKSDYPVDGVIRIGGVPTLRLWRDLEDKLSALPVLGISRLPFSGLSRRAATLVGEMGAVLSSLSLQLSGFETAKQRFLSEARRQQEALLALLKEEPLSEPSLLYALSTRLPSPARIYLGNSMPIREWDLAATYEPAGHEVWASRGVNGIDGQVSTFIGYSKAHAENWAIIGDLTALYDLPAPWVLAQLGDVRVNIVVVNNGGGKIFDRMFKEKSFQNLHQIRFKPWAELWGLAFEEWREIPSDLRSDLRSLQVAQSRVIELIPDNVATDRFWQRYAKI